MGVGIFCRTSTLIGVALVYRMGLSIHRLVRALPTSFVYVCRLGGWWELGNYCNFFPPPPKSVFDTFTYDKEEEKNPKITYTFVYQSSFVYF